MTSRMESYRRLFAHIHSTRSDLFGFWLGPFAKLPFRLGESLVEAKIPFAFDDAFDRLATTSVAELLSLIQRRFSPTATDEPSSGSLTLREECMSPRFTTSGTLDQKTVLTASRLDPYLDCGLLDSWMTRGGAGSRLLLGLEALFKRAFEEELKSRGAATYMYLVTLAMADLLDQKKTLVKSISIRGMGYERLEKAVGICLFAAVETAARSVLDSILQRNLGVDLTRTKLLLETSLNPLAFISIKSRALQNDLNPWGLSSSTASILEEIYEEILQRDPDPAALEKQMSQAMRANREAATAAARGGLRAEARSRIHDLLALFDDGRADWLRMLAAVAHRDNDLDALMSSHRSLDAIRRHLFELEKSRRIDDDGLRSIGAMRALIEALLEGDPLRRHIAGLPSPASLLTSGLEAFIAFTLDRFCDGRLENARGHLHHARAHKGSAAELLENWKAGKLYRFAADGRPFLMPMRRREQANMFIDLKGFTRRTYRAKEVVMADFMREQFYKPIMEAARKRMSVLAYGGLDERPIELHNLLGDAAAFAGGTGDLVNLARDLRRVGHEYAESLDAAAPSLAEDTLGDDLKHRIEKHEEESRKRLEDLRTQIDQVEREVDRKAKMPDSEKVLLLESLMDARFAELAEVKESARQRREKSEGQARSEAEAHILRIEAWEQELRQRQDTTRSALAAMPAGERSQALTELLGRPDRRRLEEVRQELERARLEENMTGRLLEEQRRDARGFGLETGTYISHGASAEVISLDDPVFGPLRVAISEKINEAARGTARNAEIKAKMDAHLDRERAQRGRPGLAWPFLVYVDSAFSLVLPPELSTEVERAVTQRDTAVAEEVSTELARWALRDLYRAMEQGDGQPLEMLRVLNDIHNLGVALSEEALAAFIAETLATRFHFQHTVIVSDLHRELKDAFVFLEDRISLVVCVPAEKKEDPLSETLVFRHAGNVQFRGFEKAGATGVYELLASDTRFYRLLVRLHLPAWIDDAREDPSRLITGL